MESSSKKPRTKPKKSYESYTMKKTLGQGAFGTAYLVQA